MSTPTEDEAPPRRRSAPADGGGNVFTRKLGPAPLWVWMLAGLGIALAISAVRGNRQKAAQAATTASAAGTAAGAAQTPPFIIQNFPGSGIPGPQGPAGTPGAPGAPGAPGVGGQGAPPPVTVPIRGGNPPGSENPPDLFPAAPAFPRPVNIQAHPPRQPLEYRVKPGDKLTTIAQRYGTTAEALWRYNTSPASGRPQSTINTLLQRGPDLLYSNELILIPQ